ncbi:UbiE/COQ5 methyltransferase [Russula emetica]|nr:UbiE/COQ5 methyltransferase [Russula emetica]
MQAVPRGLRTVLTITTHFGFRTVSEGLKEVLVLIRVVVFDSVRVVSSYDLMNDAMSFSVHRLWKDSFISLLHRETRVDIVDINGEMLKEGHMRFKKTMYHNTPQVAFIEANAQALPLEFFSVNTYDLYTIAFGIRNVNSIQDVLREAHRVLKLGGTFACLEFNKVTNPLLAQLYDQPSTPSLIPLLGTILAGDRALYQYFPAFAIGGDFEGDGGAWRDLWGGIACIHTGVKL